jgi:hypothetical protein
MSMATEDRLGKARAEDWPGVFRPRLPTSYGRAFRKHGPRNRDGRTRWTAKRVVLCWRVMGWIHAPALGEQFTAAWHTLAALSRRRRPGRTYAGLRKRSRRFGPDAVREFLAGLRPRLEHVLRPVWAWYGWHVFAEDGSRVEAPRTRANERALGRAGRAGMGPQGWVTTVIHLPSRVIWDRRQGPGQASEPKHLRKMLDGLGTGTLLLADGEFVGFALLRTLQRRGVEFLIRRGSNVRRLIDDTRTEFVAGRDGARLAWIWPQRFRSGVGKLDARRFRTYKNSRPEAFWLVVSIGFDSKKRPTGGGDVRVTTIRVVPCSKTAILDNGAGGVCRLRRGPA